MNICAMQFPLNYNETLIKIIVRFLKLIISQTTCMNVHRTKMETGFSKFMWINVFDIDIIFYAQLFIVYERAMSIVKN